MRTKTIVRCVQYLVMVAAIGAAVFYLLAGICCLRLEEYRQRDGNRELALEMQARRQAEEIMELYLSQGMEQVAAYAKAENVNYVIWTTSGRRVGGNYRSEDTQLVLDLDGKTLQYTYQFPEDTRKKGITYIVNIAYLELEQILEVKIHLEGVPDDLRMQAQGFFVLAGVALTVAAAILGHIIYAGRRERQIISGEKTGKRSIGKLLLWWVAVVPVWLLLCRKPLVWKIPITWEDGAEPILVQLQQSIWNMTVCGVLLGILVTGFLLHLLCARHMNMKVPGGLLQRMCQPLLKMLERLSWFQKALLVLLLVCAVEALLLGLAQYGV
ncbi:MAG: hypothetical protein K2L18_02735, partial [Acetatifactor sp.]|nr:hypothetical protein [Acetatifactor sp.]